MQSSDIIQMFIMEKEMTREQHNVNIREPEASYVIVSKVRQRLLLDIEPEGPASLTGCFER